jgi:hypothetical protein
MTMYFSPDSRVLVEDGTRALFVNKDNVVILRVVEGLPADLRVGAMQDNAGRKSLEKGLNLHPEMVRFLARDDVHEALKRAVHAQEYGWQQKLPEVDGK